MHHLSICLKGSTNALHSHVDSPHGPCGSRRRPAAFFPHPQTSEGTPDRPHATRVERDSPEQLYSGACRPDTLACYTTCQSRPCQARRLDQTTSTPPTTRTHGCLYVHQGDVALGGGRSEQCVETSHPVTKPSRIPATGLTNPTPNMTIYKRVDDSH